MMSGDARSATAEIESQTASPPFLAGGGEMGALMRAHDWSTSPLGPPDTWPRSLRSVVQLMLSNRQLMFVAWGPELAFLYNDGYAPTFGRKHPWALGRPFREVWSEIWTDIEPLVNRALAGEATYNENLHLVMERNGYPEDAWFTFSYSPLRDESGAVAGMFCAGIETTGQVNAERAVRESEIRFRALVNASADVVYRMSPDWTEMRQLDGRGFIADTEEPSVRWIDAYLYPEDRPHILAVIEEAVRTKGVFEMEHRVRRLDGTTGWTSSRAVPVLGPDGEVVEWFGMAGDITARRQAEEARRESEARFRNMADNSPVMMWVTDPTGYCTYLNRHWYDYTGQSEAEGEGYGWLEATHPDDKEEAGRVFLEANAKQVGFRVEYRLRRADGAYRWAIDTAAPRFGDDGQYLGYVGSVIDIDERREAEEHLRLLVNELNHRVKNSLSTVQAIATQTFRNPESFGQAKHEFTARIMALAQAHDILTEANWSGASLRDIVLRTVDPHRAQGHDRFRIEGPHVLVTPKAALSLSMAVHELSTNAAKYGSLSVEGGRVGITWSIDPQPDHPRLRMSWQETGGPPVIPPTKKGFGSRLIEYGLAAELGGDVRIAYEPDGVVCTIDAPLPEA